VACLVLIYLDGTEPGTRFPFIRNVVVGRHTDCEILIDHKSVSRRHARIRWDGERGWIVDDLESVNGTYVNDVRVPCAALHDADFIKIGSAIFKFLASSDPIPPDSDQGGDSGSGRALLTSVKVTH
jgi:two-component system cell cycle response regulator